MPLVFPLREHTCPDKARRPVYTELRPAASAQLSQGAKPPLPQSPSQPGHGLCLPVSVSASSSTSGPATATAAGNQMWCPWLERRCPVSSSLLIPHLPHPPSSVRHLGLSVSILMDLQPLAALNRGFLSTSSRAAFASSP